jgi:ubiquinone/menaquinone biosynthesis C-methylase UbiE
LLERGD